MSALWEYLLMEGATLPVKYSLVPSRDTVLGPSLEKMVSLVVAVLLSWNWILFSSMVPLETSKSSHSAQELASGPITYANTLSVGLIQTIRTGLYKGQIIEDAGIKTDTVFRPQWSDLQPNPTTNTQYDRIAASLARTGQENGQSRLHFVCEPFSIEKPISGFSLEVEAAGIYEFTVFQADGKTVAAKKRRSLATKKQKFAIPVSTVGSALGNSQIIIVGKTAGKQVLKTKRNVRIFQMMTSTWRSALLGLLLQASLSPLDSTNPQLPRLGMAGTT
ncbi:hypothetical protein BASA61_007166 [Batrachochytrium salamandrivorans]|nr:hypothetical protein BASA61_007166 [Batrachochytrium salamandrivorans]